MKLELLNGKFEKNNDLSLLAEKFGTDKSTTGYTSVYHEIMKEKREIENVSLLEIGIFKGSSIKMWHQYFRHANIFGIDNGRLLPNTNLLLGDSNQNPSEHDISLLDESNCVTAQFDWLENNRIKCAIADQRSYKQLLDAFSKFGNAYFDYIVDDGHHFQEHQQKSFALMFPHVKPGGYYIIEDICCHNDLLNGSYWGQKENDCSDSTDFVISKYISTGKLQSPYMNESQTTYIQNNIEDIFLFDAAGKNFSPVIGASKLLIVNKK